MNGDQLYQSVVATLSPDPTSRMQGEIYLKQQLAAPGFVVAMLQIISAEGDAAIQLAATVYLKNLIGKRYHTLSDAAPEERLTPDDRALLRRVIFEALLRARPAVEAQWAAALRVMLKADFPDEWPELVPQIEAALASGDARHAYTGLVVLQQVVHEFKWRSKKMRGPLNELAGRLFGVVAQLGAALVPLDPGNTDAGRTLHVICKLYYGTIQYELPKALMAPESVQAWIALLLALIAKELPEAAQPADRDERPEFPWWKAKKWAFHTLNRLFVRYGNPNEVDKPYRAFAKKFLDGAAVPVLHAYLKQAEGVVQGVYLPPHVQCLLCDYFCMALKPRATWQVLRPHLRELVGLVVLRLLRMSDEEVELFEDDPVEFLRRQCDFEMEQKNPAMAAAELLADLIEHRGKTAFAPVMQLLGEALAQSRSDPRARDAALRAVLVLQAQLAAPASPYRAQLDGFLAEYALPELQSPHGFLRVRALCLCSLYARIEPPLERLRAVFDAVLHCLVADKELPVMVQAAQTFEDLLEDSASVAEWTRPHVPQIMRRLLDLAAQADGVESLASAMETFVDKFSDDVAPFAADLAAQIGAAFAKLAEQMHASNVAAMAAADDDEAAVALAAVDEGSGRTLMALGLIKTLLSLVYAVKSSPDVLAQIEVTVLPLCASVLERDLVDAFEEAMQLIAAVVYHRHAVSDAAWACLPVLAACVARDGEDYVGDAVPALDNIATYGAARFAQDPSAARLLLDVVRIGFAAQDAQETDHAGLCDLLLTMLLCLPPAVMEPYWVPILQQAVQLMVEKRDPDGDVSPVCVFYLQVILGAIYSQPRRTLAALAEQLLPSGKTAVAEFFEGWFRAVPQLKRVQDKRLAVLAASKVLLEIPAAETPAPVQAYLASVFPMVLEVCKTLPEALHAREQARREIESDNDGSDDESSAVATPHADSPAGGASDNEDVRDSEADAYMQYLAREGRKAMALKGGAIDESDLALLTSALAQKARRGASGASDGSESDGSDGSSDSDESYGFSYADELLEEDPYHTTPLDNIDIYQAVQHLFQALAQAQGAAVAAQWTQSLSPDAQRVATEMCARPNEQVALARHVASRDS